MGPSDLPLAIPSAATMTPPVGGPLAWLLCQGDLTS